MKNTIAILLIALLGLSSCGGARIDQDEVEHMLFHQKRGVFAGIEIQDKWEDVKNNCHEGWTVREEIASSASESDIYQLRKDWDEGNDFMYIKFYLTENKEVEAMEFRMRTKTDENKLFAKKLVKMFEADLNQVLLGEIADNKWQKIAPDGTAYYVDIVENNSEDGNSLSVNVSKQN